MSSIRAVVASWLNGPVLQADLPRSSGRRALLCEALEGRQLLSGAAASLPGWWTSTAAGAGGSIPADVHKWSFPGGIEKHQGHGTGAHAFEGPGHSPFTPSPQVQADFTTLQNDMKTLESKVPATLTTQISADKAVIAKALAALTPTQRQADHIGHPKVAPGSDPFAGLAADLKAANVPDAQINSIEADFKTYQSTLKSIAPALNTKIAADQATLSKDLPASADHHPVPLGGSGPIGLGS
jgi:hypothetical protein